MHEYEYLFNFICLSCFCVPFYGVAANKPLLNWRSCIKLRFILCIFPYFLVSATILTLSSIRHIKCKQTSFFYTSIEHYHFILPHFLIKNATICFQHNRKRCRDTLIKNSDHLKFHCEQFISCYLFIALF